MKVNVTRWEMYIKKGEKGAGNLDRLSRAAKFTWTWRWRVPEVQLRDCQYASDMAVAAIASADEANGWLKPEKNGKEEKEAKGEAPDSH